MRSKWIYALIGLLTAGVIFLIGGALNPVEVRADGEHVHCICGNTETNTVTPSATEANGHTHNYAQEWQGTDSFPTASGYYYLTKDISQGAVGAVAGSEVYLCLNGHKITGTAKGRLLQLNNTSISATNPSKYVITNCGEKDDSVSGSEKGAIIRSNSATYTGQGGTFWLSRAGATLELYNVIVDQNVMPVNHRGGLIECANSGATVRMYGTTLKNGNVIGTNGHGGAISFSSGTVALYGSEILDGKAAQNGGNIYMTGGTLLLRDTEVSGGTASSGNDIYMTGGTLTIEGVDETTKNARIENGDYVFSGGTVTTHGNHCVCSGLFTGTHAEECPYYEEQNEKGVGIHANGVTWIAWTSKTALPGSASDSGYYYLTGDVTLSAAVTAPENGFIYLCLNGHKVQWTGNNRMIQLTVNDTTQSRKYVVTNCGEKDYENQKGLLLNARTGTSSGQGMLFWTKYSDDYMIELYHVLVDGNTRVSTSTTGGGNILVENGVVNLYDVTIKSGGTSAGPGGSICVKGTGTMTVMDSEIAGGTADGNGGTIYNAGTMTIRNSTINGGSAAGLGNGIYVSGGTLNLGGKTVINGLYLTSGTTVAVSSMTEGAKISIELQDHTGVFANDVETDVSAMFEASEDGYSLKYDASAKTLSVVFIHNAHCVCGGFFSGDHASDCPYADADNGNGGKIHADGIVWEVWTEQNTLPTAAGYYYLENDVTLSAAHGVAGQSQKVYICLNGYTVTQTGNARISNINQKSRQLVITDCKERTGESGTLASSAKYTAQGGFFHVGTAGCTLELYNIKVDGTGSSATTGGLISVTGSANLTAYGVTLTGGTGTEGGLLYINGGDASLVDSTLQNGTATGGNGGNINLNNGSLILSGCTVVGGSSTANGGSLRLNQDTTAVISDCTITGGTTETNGGSIWSYGTLDLTGSTITGGIATNNGGGLYVAAGSLTVEHSEFTGGTAVNGGNICVNASTPTFTDVTITGGTATGNGGNVSLHTYGGFSGDQITLLNGEAGEAGGSVYVNSTGVFSLTNQSTVTGGRAPRGGNICVNAGSASLVSTTVTGGTAYYDSEITDKLLNAKGGNVYIGEGTVTMDQATVLNGTANRGGNFYLGLGATLNASGSAVSGGTVSAETGDKPESARGANIFIYQNSKVTLTACTVKAPSSTDSEAANLYVNITPIAPYEADGEAARTKLTIEDGTVISNDGADLVAVYINGSRKAGYNGVVSMSGGTILAGEGTAIENHGKLEITGGYIQGAVSSSTLKPNETRMEEVSASISGGYFTVNPTANSEITPLSTGAVIQAVSKTVDQVTYTYQVVFGLASWSMTVEADLSIHFNVYQALLDAFPGSSLKFEIALNGDTETAEAEEFGDYYRFTYRGVTADLMTAPITVTLSSVAEGGDETVIQTKTITVKEYLNSVIAYQGLESEEGVKAENLTEEKEALYALIRDLFIYGREAQKYFNTNTEDPVVEESYLDSKGNLISAESVTDPNYGADTNTVENKIFVSSVTVLHRNANRIRFTVVIPDGANIKDCITVTAGGSEVEYEASLKSDIPESYKKYGTFYTVTTEPIAPTAYGTEIVLTGVYNEATETELHYSVNQYAYNIAESAKKTEAEKSFVKALYLYGVSADAYAAAAAN